MGGDTQLKKHVEDELRWQPSVDEASIGVSVKDAIVTLTGHVRSYAEKMAAERAVMGYDVCAYNNAALGFTERINEILERYPLVQLAAVDTQVYYAVRFL